MTKVALYARVSSGPQESSLDAQLFDLRELAAREGFEVVEEVSDLAEKRRVLDRPGLDRLRELAATGTIEAVWAVEFRGTARGMSQPSWRYNSRRTASVAGGRATAARGWAARSCGPSRACSPARSSASG